ncbi:hypothetical protein TTHERM_00235210 (macronuclear) [Tetrahymena thermophila SB210]|uniref:Transmembrane protein n=1 Tax=Tetrahymena thermophila (strain SB210) TaxID=312017 RepID=Q23BK4_TETTS|nr:hypothetical protein TTHERM_00235210 [Tetrahymena thermophila SB210]EAR94114.1 hypothetical protein TTHERM_00235210 [Tetrahymena thermophila SB210]|eukprot:XP_001014359.1 hypothetical protein TTHERM_00235210 [Tetrahymena thermophila SB210]
MKAITLLFVIALVAVNANNKTQQCQDIVMKKIELGLVCSSSDTECLDALLSLNQCAYNCASQIDYDYDNVAFINSCLQLNCTSSNIRVQHLLQDFLNCFKSIKITNLRLSKNIQQCQSDLFKKLEQGKYCKPNDQDCLNALVDFNQCATDCAKQIDYDYDNQAFIISCVKQNCSSSNAEVQRFMNDYIKCSM